jgi:hypothetical protein
MASYTSLSAMILLPALLPPAYPRVASASSAHDGEHRDNRSQRPAHWPRNNRAKERRFIFSNSSLVRALLVDKILGNENLAESCISAPMPILYRAFRFKWRNAEKNDTLPHHRMKVGILVVRLDVAY